VKENRSNVSRLIAFTLIIFLPLLGSFTGTAHPCDSSDSCSEGQQFALNAAAMTGAPPAIVGGGGAAPASCTSADFVGFKPTTNNVANIAGQMRCGAYTPTCASCTTGTTTTGYVSVYNTNAGTLYSCAYTKSGASPAAGDTLIGGSAAIANSAGIQSAAVSSGGSVPCGTAVWVCVSAVSIGAGTANLWDYTTDTSWFQTSSGATVDCPANLSGLTFGDSQASLYSYITLGP
jgi:hypothetical protein